MKFKAIIENNKRARELIKFMSDIYESTLSSDVLVMAQILDNPMLTQIVVFDYPVTSKLEEDRGIKPTAPWNLYTFMDLMKNAGFYMEPSVEESSIRVFTMKDENTCKVCGSDCRHTGVVVGVPWYGMGDIEIYEAKMCLHCAGKFMDEVNCLVDIIPERKASPQAEPEEKPKQGKIARFFKKLFRK